MLSALPSVSPLEEDVSGGGAGLGMIKQPAARAIR
jgi:hypothetical protein